MNLSSSVIFACLFCVGLVSCGGGGESTDSGNLPNPGNSNTPPTANAGPDVSARSDTSVFLSASGSADTDGTILTYSWSQLSGVAVTLENASTPTPFFTAPIVNSDTPLTFRVTVTDDDAASASDDITVIVVANIPPVADAGSDQSAAVSTQVELDGSASNDPDGSIAGFAWSQTDGLPVTLADANQSIASFTVPATATVGAQLTFQLTVTDDNGASATDDMVVTVGTNASPVADAGPDQSVGTAALVSLDGTGSGDSDGTIASYSWVQTGGPAVELSGADQAIAAFTTPTLSSDTSLTFELTVTDDLGTAASDTVTVSVITGSFTVSGTISVPQGTMVDSDVNDILVVPVSNNSFAEAQPIPNPVTLGGYANKPGAGPAGTLQQSGDEFDVFAVHLLEGQVITLLVASADPSADDVDLALYDEDYNEIDRSAALDEVEQIMVPATGDYYVVALAYSGASNYTLIIGQDQVVSTPSTLRLSNDFIPGDTVVKYHDALPASALNKGRSTIAAQLGFERKAGAPGREMLLQLNLSGNQQTLSKTSTSHLPGLGKFKSENDRRKWQTLMAIKALNKDPRVEHAEPNFILKPLLVPDDEYYPLQWHYQQINLPAAWDMTTGSQDVTVAVIDTGVLLNHPDLQGQLVAGYDFISSVTTAADDDGIDSNPDDAGDSDGSVPSSFHGTHVAGTIAASSNNSRGVAGIAWNVRVMPLRALGVGGGSGYDINQAIRYAAGLSNDSGQVPENPADIINLSLGGPGFSQVTQSTIDAARAAGVIIVAAAGNDATSQFFYPASYNGVISVSAVGPQNTLAPYSNFGSEVDVTAPGGDLRRDVNGDGYADGVLSTAGDDSSGTTGFNFNFQNGTSMASPHVAGVIALMKSVNDGLTPDQIDTLLAQGELTDDLGTTGRDNSFGHGLINAQKAVTAALTALGELPGENPELGVTPASLNFSNVSELDIVVRNNGGGSLNITGVTASEAWLTIAAQDTDAQGLGIYTVSTNTAGLADGIYSATITVTASTGTFTVPVIMPVGNVEQTGDAGFIYVLLIDLNSGLAIDQDNVPVNNGLYQYQFDDVPAGRYQVIAGSDRDHDDYICDSGEACGAYATLDSPQTVSPQSGDLSNLDFVINFPSALPSNLDASGAEHSSDSETPGVRKLQRGKGNE